uniref:Alpha-farnesene synthase n=1 Tax=Santalum album TaxID=35974 RepID=A0A678XZM4_SANAL|nr:alpha-farnesene synthase [Santalum album]
MVYLRASSVEQQQQCGDIQAVDNQPLDTIDQRRCTNYKPNIWNYDAIQSLTSEYWGKMLVKRVEKLREDVAHLLSNAQDQTTKLELVNWIEKLGLANLFPNEIKEALDAIALDENQKDLPAVALRFRLLRQHGYNVPQDVFNAFMGASVGQFIDGKHVNIEGMTALLEASHLGLESESMLTDAKAFSTAHLKGIRPCVEEEQLGSSMVQEIGRALELSMHHRVQWFDVKWNISAYESEEKCNFSMLHLAKLNFNMVQATHQDNLKDMSRWWRNLGLAKSMNFTRDRLVESFLWAVGVAFEPEFGCLRKWLTKTINLVLVIDDVYDAYGSLEELESFTHAIEMWDSKEVQQLPKCMKICFQALHNTIFEIANEIQKERGGSSVLPHLKKAWRDFCMALFVEAKWYNMGYTPSLQEYLDNGWVSSCGPLLCAHALLAVIQQEDPIEDVKSILEKNQDIVQYSSLIIRLCNDIGTSTAEAERGDAASSILCYMQEANVPEETARKQIKEMISTTWKKINGRLMDQSSPWVQPFVRMVINMARVAHCIYQHGDGFGVQDRKTRVHVLSLLFKPLSLD